MRASSAKYLLSQGFENIWLGRVMAFASFCVLLVSILLVGFSILFSVNVNRVVGEIEDMNEIAVYLETDVDPVLAKDIGQSILSLRNVSSVLFISKEQGFEEMKRQLEENGETNADLLFGSIADENPLPDAYRVKVSDISEIGDTVMKIQSLGHIYRINAPSNFAEVMLQVRKVTLIISAAVIAALLLISLIIIYNSGRVSVQSRSREIGIMKLVGASNSFIRIPFFIEGMVIGAFAGLTATAITWLSYDGLISSINAHHEIVAIIGTSLLPFYSVAMPIALSYIIAGALIGAFGTMFSVRKHLNV